MICKKYSLGSQSFSLNAACLKMLPELLF